MNTNNTDKPMEWEDKFDEEFLTLSKWDENPSKDVYEDIKQFIRKAIQATREETLGDVSKVMVDWAFRKYPSRKVLTEVAKYINTEVKSLTNKSEI